MKILALIIAVIGVTFLGVIAWNGLHDETPVEVAIIDEATVATWTNYQACIETVTLEAAKQILEIEPEDGEGGFFEVVGGASRRPPGTHAHHPIRSHRRMR